MSSAFSALLLAVAGFSSFSISDAIAKSLGAHYNAMQIVGITAPITALLAFVVLWREIGSLTPKTTAKAPHAVRSVCMTGAALLNFAALPHLPFSQFYTLMFTSPFITALLARLWLKDPLTPRALFVIFLGFVGVFIAIDPSFSEVNSWTALLLFSASCFSVASLASRSIPVNEPIALMALFPKVLAAVCLLPYGITVISGDLSLTILLLILAQSVTDLLGYLLIGRAFQIGAAPTIAPIHYVQILWGIGFGWLLWTEIPTSSELLGATLVVICGIILIRAPKADLCSTSLDLPPAPVDESTC